MRDIPQDASPIFPQPLVDPLRELFLPLAESILSRSEKAELASVLDREQHDDEKRDERKQS